MIRHTTSVWQGNWFSAAIVPYQRPFSNTCPRMVTCELSRVWCWLSRRQHNMQHVQITRVEEKLVKTRKRRWAPFAQKVCGNSLKSDL